MVKLLSLKIVFSKLTAVSAVWKSGFACHAAAQCCAGLQF
jgi:hypothetical protein